MNQTHLPVRTARGRLGGLREAFESPIESGFYRHLRVQLWSRVAALPGPVVEIGSGRGQNFTYHPPGAVLATDIDAGKLARARDDRGSGTHLAIMDAGRLALADGSFGVAVGTFVFCSLPDPVAGLCELSRVLRPEGRLLLLEHVLPEWQPARALWEFLNPLASRILGANINRPTEKNIVQAGFRIENVHGFAGGLFEMIEATRLAERIRHRGVTRRREWSRSPARTIDFWWPKGTGKLA
jgi:phosphatidylethanolamine/phosphatidyl-N-methylethanolamine N-methyltransferase